MATLHEIGTKVVEVGEPINRPVTAPEWWSDNAVMIAATKYMLDSEHSVMDWLRRVAGTIAKASKNPDLEHKLYGAMLLQQATFNSPVHFNVGRVEHPQCWACLIYGVGDHFDGPGGIKEWWTVESDTFRNGSGSGVSVDAIRENGAPLRGSKYGIASGPLSFMRPADSIAGSITSGGRTRRAAKMVVIGDRHPDIFDFIWCKAHEEKKARALRDAGFDIGINGADSIGLLYQNANNSIRVSDALVNAVATGKDWDLTARLTGAVVRTVPARKIWREIAQAAWECADPGVQFHDTINRWHTCKNDGEIRASNPCSEYLFLDDTCCNLASINLLKFHDERGAFLIEDFVSVVETFIEAQDILVDLSSYPTDEITRKNPEYRTLGLGYANLGALLMAHAFAYDSDEGRDLAAAISSLMQAAAYRKSALLAQELGAYSRYEANKEHHLEVLSMHKAANAGLLARDLNSTALQIALEAEHIWAEAAFLAAAHGLRNAQVTVIAPTGTISFVMDCETTGIEPLMAIPGVGGITVNKTLVGGGNILWDELPECVSLGLSRLPGKHKYDSDEEALLKDPLFETANGHLPLRPEAHVLMMAAVQPFISGGISKTVNLPKTASVEDVENIHKLAWEKGVKSIAIYRDGCKTYQPMTVNRESDGEPTAYVTVASSPSRQKLPKTRVSVTHKFEISDHEFYLTVGFYDAAMTQLGEVFLTGNKQGSAFGGMASMWSIALSKDLQRGVPFDELLNTFRYQAFEPAGVVIGDDSPIHFAASLPDYVVRWIDWFLNDGGRERLFGDVQKAPAVEIARPKEITSTPGEECPVCHRMSLVWTGTCQACRHASCGFSTGGCG